MCVCVCMAVSICVCTSVCVFSIPRINVNPFSQHNSHPCFVMIYFHSQHTSSKHAAVTQGTSKDMFQPFLTNKPNEHQSTAHRVPPWKNKHKCIPYSHYGMRVQVCVCCLHPVVSVPVFSSVPVGFLSCWHRCALSQGTSFLGLLLMQTESVFVLVSLCTRLKIHSWECDR